MTLTKRFEKEKTYKLWYFLVYKNFNLSAYPNPKWKNCLNINVENCVSADIQAREVRERFCFNINLKRAIIKKYSMGFKSHFGINV